MGEGKRAAQDRGSIVGKGGDRLRRERRKDSDVQRNFVVKHAKAAANRRTVVAGGGENEANPWSSVPWFHRKTVTIETHSCIQCKPRTKLPVVLCEDRKLVSRGMGGQRATVNHPAGKSFVFSQNIHRKIADIALIAGVRVGIAESQQMPPRGLDRPQVERLRPLVEARSAPLLLEIAARILFRIEHHLSGC